MLGSRAKIDHVVHLRFGEFFSSLSQTKTQRHNFSHTPNFHDIIESAAGQRRLDRLHNKRYLHRSVWPPERRIKAKIASGANASSSL